MTPESETSGVTIRILNPPGKTVVPPDGKPPLRRGDDNAAEGNLSAPHPNTISKRSTDPDELNDRSLVIRLTFGRRSFLLCGDISEASERRLSRTDADLRSDVLFVPHHGGSRSSTLPFLERVRPEVAVVSCGLKNVFRFPHADVIERLERIRSRVFRTDRDGAITIVTDGNDLKTGIFRAPVP
jgi:competence protein ComEC